MASRSRLPQDKTMLMNMAATWESFAVTAQEHIDRQKGMECAFIPGGSFV
jgi:hypothetical protein